MASRQQRAHIDWWRFMCRLALVLPADLNAGNTPEVIARVLARPVDKQVLFLVHQVLAVKLAHFEVRRQLDSVSGTGFFAVTTEYAAREIDTEELRITPPVFILVGLERDAIDGTGGRAEIARDTALAAVGIAR